MLLTEESKPRVRIFWAGLRIDGAQNRFTKWFTTKRLIRSFLSSSEVLQWNSVWQVPKIKTSELFLIKIHWGHEQDMSCIVGLCNKFKNVIIWAKGPISCYLLNSLHSRCWSIQQVFPWAQRCPVVTLRVSCQFLLNKKGGEGLVPA